MATETKKSAIHIDGVNDADRSIVLHPENKDLFVSTGKQVIQACQLKISIDLWLQEFGAMVGHVRKWIEEHKSSIKECWGAPRNARIVLFFVPSSSNFDFDLADALTQLNSHVVREFNIGMIEIRQVPADEIDRFLDIEQSMLIYGEGRRPHQAVEA